MFDLFIMTKLIHFCAVIVMVGATVINGLIHAEAKRLTPSQAVPMLGVVLRINRLLMGPSLIVIPASGLFMMVQAGHDFGSIWIATSFGLSIALIMAFRIGAKIERQLHKIASDADFESQPALPTQYEETFKKAVPLGGGALLMSITTVILMIFKP